MIEVRCVVDARAQVGEGAVWDPDSQCLWWTDIRGKIMHCYDATSGTDRTYAMPVRVGCFALRQAGGFVLAAEHGFWFWNPNTGSLDHVLDVEADRPGNRMNDGGCDRQGRLIASSMNMEDPRRPTGACWRLDGDLKAVKLFDGCTIGNGIAFSPVGDRFYFADTPTAEVVVYEYDSRTGALGPRRRFVDMTALKGLPDGATVDAEGGYWLAGVGGGRVYRFAGDGSLDRTIEVPIAKPTRPMFGGPALGQLYLTSIKGDADPPPAGGLFRIDGVDARGLPEPRFCA